MKKKEIKILKPRRVGEYRYIYDGQLYYQRASLVIAPENKHFQMFIDCDDCDGPGLHTAFAEIYGTRIYVDFKPFLSLERVCKLMEDCIPFAARIVSGYSYRWKNGHKYGELNDDARAALDELRWTVLMAEKDYSNALDLMGHRSRVQRCRLDLCAPMHRARKDWKYPY